MIEMVVSTNMKMISPFCELHTTHKDTNSSYYETIMYTQSVMFLGRLQAHKVYIDNLLKI